MKKRPTRTAWWLSAILAVLALGRVGANATPYGVEQRRLGPDRTLARVYGRRTNRTIWTRTVISPNGIDVLKWSSDGRAVAMVDSPPTRLILWREGERVRTLGYYPSQGVQEEDTRKHPNSPGKLPAFEAIQDLIWSADNQRLLLRGYWTQGEMDWKTTALYCVNVRQERAYRIAWAGVTRAQWVSPNRVRYWAKELSKVVGKDGFVHWLPQKVYEQECR